MFVVFRITPIFIRWQKTSLDLVPHVVALCPSQSVNLFLLEICWIRRVHRNARYFKSRWNAVVHQFYLNKFRKMCERAICSEVKSNNLRTSVLREHLVIIRSEGGWN